jgi:anti-sigma factor RsiW
MNGNPANGPCEDYELEVADLVDGTLAPEKARVVSLHLAGCCRCRKWRDEYAAMDRQLARAIPRPRLTIDFEWKLAARLRALGGAPVDTRAAAEQEYATLMDGLRRRLRGATIGSAASAVAAGGCALAVLPALIDRLGPALAAFNAPAAWTGALVAGLAIVAGALAWSFGSGALPGLRLRG